MRFLDDNSLARLRAVVDVPDLAGTRYEDPELIGRGGMGAVFRVRDRLLDRDVALKVLDESATNEITTEARLLARLEHPGIVPVHDAGVLADGRAYFAMKLVRGARLNAWATAMPLAEILRAFQKVCEAVAFAHAQGIVHRDLKPSNVMIGEFGEVMTLDWGVARDAQCPTPEIAGTPRYMAPEQGYGHADARSDVYSLGAMLADLLPATAPGPLRSICSKATRDIADDRYATAIELRADVARFLDHERVFAHKENWFEQGLRLANAHRVLLGLVLAYLVMRAILFVWRLP